MLIRDLTDKLATYFPDSYKTLTLNQLTSFTTLAAEFLKRTDGVYGTSATEAPIEFISHCLERGQPPSTWAGLWNLTYDSLASCNPNPTTIAEHGIPTSERPSNALVVPQHTFNPPTLHCLTCTTPRTGVHVTLDMREQVYGYLLGLNGIETVQYFSGYCRNCHATYTPCYLRKDNQRQYYTQSEGQPKDYFQVTQHYFMTKQLANHYNQTQSIAVVSATNLVQLYNQTHAKEGTTYPNTFSDTQFQRRMSFNVCTLGLDINRLMRSFNERDVRLKSDAHGTDDQRFYAAMEEHLEWVRIEGTYHSSHVCSVCTEVTPIPNTDEAKIMRAVVTDGVTLGYWCCSASEAQLRALDPNSTANHCDQYLARVIDRYCPAHTRLLKNICPAQPCVNKVVAGKPTCSDPEHEAAYLEFKEQNTSLFGLPRRMKRPNTHIRLDPSVLISPNTGEVNITDEYLMNSEVQEREHESARDGGESQPTKKPLLSRKRTHNEQLVVSPCGMVLARKTFYKSESLPKVKEFIYEVFPDEMPQVIFYDNACGLYQHIATNPTDVHRFQNTLLPVDVFHMKSHKTTHTSCQINNDPNLFPELKKATGNGGWKWKFNSSAAEMVNAWFGRFDPICRNMHAIKYQFFLEEMIRLHNNRLHNLLCKRNNVEFCGNIDYRTCDLTCSLK